jgi:hypothetical protein
VRIQRLPVTWHMPSGFVLGLSKTHQPQVIHVRDTLPISAAREFRPLFTDTQ